MKDIVLAIITRLKSDPAIEAIVDDRIFRARLPSKPAFPAVVVSTISPKRKKRAHNGGKTGIRRIQCTSLAQGDTGDSIADNLSELITDNLDGLKDTYLPPGVFVIRIDEQPGQPVNDQKQNLWGYTRDFIVQHNV